MWNLWKRGKYSIQSTADVLSVKECRLPKDKNVSLGSKNVGKIDREVDISTQNDQVSGFLLENSHLLQVLARFVKLNLNI